MNIQTSQPTSRSTRPLLAAAAIAALSLSLIFAFGKASAHDPKSGGSDEQSQCAEQSQAEDESQGEHQSEAPDESQSEQDSLKNDSQPNDQSQAESSQGEGESDGDKDSEGGDKDSEGGSDSDDNCPSVAESVAESIPASVAESVPASVKQSVAESVEQSVEAGTGTPQQSQPNTALSQNGSSPLPTIAFSLILLASLGTLAYANIKTVRTRS